MSSPTWRTQWQRYLVVLSFMLCKFSHTICLHSLLYLHCNTAAHVNNFFALYEASLASKLEENCFSNHFSDNIPANFGIEILVAPSFLPKRPRGCRMCISASERARSSGSERIRRRQAHLSTSPRLKVCFLALRCSHKCTYAGMVTSCREFRSHLTVGL